MIQARCDQLRCPALRSTAATDGRIITASPMATTFTALSIVYRGGPRGG